MPLHPQSLRAMRDELSKLAAPPEEVLTSARKKQMMKDAPIVIGTMGLGWGVGKTIGDIAAKRVIKDQKLLSKVRRYGPSALALTGTGIGLALSQQRRRLKKRRDAAQKKEDAKRVRKPT